MQAAARWKIPATSCKASAANVNIEVVSHELFITAQLVNRMFTTLEGRGKLRTAAEEYNLGANHKEGAETHQEYISTFTPEIFNGHDLLNRLESDLNEAQVWQKTMMQSRKRKRGGDERDRVWYNFADSHGHRPRGVRDRLLYLICE